MIPARARRFLRVAFGQASGAPATSTDYETIPASEVDDAARSLSQAWQDPRIPQAQIELVEAQLRDFALGARVPVFDVFVDLIRLIPNAGSKSLLEVGCSSGFYAEVLRHRGLTTRYAGCDYSASLIDLGRIRFPGIALDVQDATALAYDDASQDIVVSGCCILHIADFPAAIREASRVAREYVLFHRTPVLHLAPTTYYRKLAYGVECLEIHFNETELLRHFRDAGLRVVQVESVGIGATAPPGDVQVIKSYLC